MGRSTQPARIVKTPMSAVLELPTDQIDLNTTLLSAVTSAANKGLAMAGLEAKCVGVSRIPSRHAGAVTGMIGVHGNVSGFATVNLSEQLALFAVEQLLHEQYEKLTNQVIDGVGEMTNMIVGGIKSSLAKTDWAIDHITVPSMIVGEGYQVAFASGIELIDVTFEVNNDAAVLVSDKLLHVTVSLLKL